MVSIITAPAAAAVPAIIYLRILIPIFRRTWPDLENAVPWPIWLLSLAILFGALAGSAGLYHRPEFGLSFLRGAILPTALALAINVHSARITTSIQSSRRILFPAVVGSVGMAVGGFIALVALVFYAQSTGAAFILDSTKPLAAGLIALVNGWTGDSSTQLPILGILTDRFSHEVMALLPPCVLIVDWGFVMASLLVTTALVNNYQKHRDVALATKKVAAHGAEPIVNYFLLGLICLGSGGVSAFLNQHFRTSLTYPFLIGAFYLVTAYVGFWLARREIIFGNRNALKLLFMWALGSFGIQSGTELIRFNLNHIFGFLGLITLIGFGCFLGHVLSLSTLRKKYNVAELAIASMCCVGGFVTAPVVAAQYSEDLIEAVYLSKLLINLFSLVVAAILCGALYLSFPGLR